MARESAFGEVSPRAGPDAGFCTEDPPRNRAAQPPPGRSVQRRPKDRNLPQQVRSRAGGPASQRASSPPQVAQATCDSSPSRAAERPAEPEPVLTGGGCRHELSPTVIAVSCSVRVVNLSLRRRTSENLDAVVDSGTNLFKCDEQRLFDVVIGTLAGRLNDHTKTVFGNEGLPATTSRSRTSSLTNC